jgi:hypothetical protein
MAMRAFTAGDGGGALHFSFLQAHNKVDIHAATIRTGFILRGFIYVFFCETMISRSLGMLLTDKFHQKLFLHKANTESTVHNGS